MRQGILAYGSSSGRLSSISGLSSSSGAPHTKHHDLLLRQRLWPLRDGSASLLAAFLRGHGHRVFVYDKAQRAVDGGDGWRGAIQAGLLGCSVFVAMCSSGYAASESAWTTREFFLADEKKKYIVPLHHSGVYPPPKLAIMLTGVPYFPKVYVIPLVMPG